MKSAIFSCLGLGDGLIASVLANNLQLNGSTVTLFHPFLKQLQSWFPSIEISPFPPVEQLSRFDAFFFFYEKTEQMQKILKHCETHYPLQTKVLNPIATLNQDYPYWEMGKFSGKRTLVDNITAFCRESLHLTLITKDNGIKIPQETIKQKHPRRVIVHPMSSRAGKNWPQKKFLRVAQQLKEHGYDPVFILKAAERTLWDLSQIEAPDFQNLNQLAHYVCSCGFMIGNDSGIGHLASCLGLPTLTICRHALIAQFWKPAWAIGSVITPYSWIPNLKGLRLRDTYWKKWISVRRVMREFFRLVKRHDDTSR